MARLRSVCMEAIATRTCFINVAGRNETALLFKSNKSNKPSAGRMAGARYSISQVVHHGVLSARRSHVFLL